MNRGQLKTRVSRLAGMSLGTSDDEIDETEFLEELANEAVVDILTRTRINITEQALSLNGESLITLGTPTLRISNLKMDDLPLTEGPRNNLLPDQYAFLGYNQLLLGVVPSIGSVLTFWGTARPTPMTGDSHDPANATYGGIPVEHHRAITNYMLWHAADKAGDQQVGRGERYRVLYEGQDGLGSAGSDLGKIKFAVNLRGGVSLVTRQRPVLAGERDSGYWTG